MEIGIFQLENLMISQARFHFLRLDQAPVADVAVEKWLARATPIAEVDVMAFLAKNSPNKEFPVILFSSDAKQSERCAATLDQAGYGNSYWLGL